MTNTPMGLTATNPLQYYEDGGGYIPPLLKVAIGEEPNSAEEIAKVCDEIKSLLIEKNRKYGDSALNPARIMSKSDSIEQIKVRIDDKLNRIKNAQSDEDEDVVQDLIGYLVLLTIAKRRQAKTNSLHN